MRPPIAENETPGTSAPVASDERQVRTCVACSEPISELLETRPEYCFVCAVHVACACADETNPIDR